MKTLTFLTTFTILTTLSLAVPTTLRQQQPTPSPQPPQPSQTPQPQPQTTPIIQQSPVANPETTPVTQQSPVPNPETTPVIGQSPIPSPAAGESPAPVEDVGTGVVAGADESVEPDASASPSGEGDDDDAVCFPGDAEVVTEEGKKLMKDLVVGDKVMVDEGRFSEVFMFTHKMSEVVYEFVKVIVEGGDSVRLTPGHYMYVNDKLMAAKNVIVGDEVVSRGVVKKVVGVERVMGKGLYNPQTLDGDIVVDGVKVSTYTTAVEPAFAHGLLAPLRMVWKVAGVGTGLFERGNFGLVNFVPKGLAAY